MKKTFDYIVIGSGAAGSIVATRLAEDPGVSVLVVEAGITDSTVTVRMPGAQVYPLGDAKRTWSFETGPEPELNNRTITHVRGRMLGGSSSLNGMVYVRGNPRDFDGWASLGLPDWSYAHCLPYFKKLESNDRGANDYRGGDGPIGITTHKADWPIFQAFLKAGEQAGHPISGDYNAFRQEGTCVYQANIRRGVRASAGLAYLRPALKGGRIELRLNALVSRIRFSGNKRAVGIDYSLFIVSRYREEREDGKDALDGIATTLATAGKAVFLSALTVVLSLSAIFLVPVMVFRSMALGMILSVVATAAASLTLLPAILVALGDRVLVARGEEDPDRAAEGRWARWTAAAMRRPGATLAAGLGVLLLLAAPALGMRLGMPGARARTVIGLARAVADGKLDLMPNADIEATLENLRALPGVGEWTAQYIAMRALAWPDAFPHTDLGVMKALGTKDPKRVLAGGEAWRPWRAYAVMHLWNSLTKD